jgi:hypothetical protein
MKYVRFFWTISIILFVVPFLGIPQGVKDFIIIIISFVIGFFAWVRAQAIRHKREIIEAQSQIHKLEEVA